MDVNETRDQIERSPRDEPHKLIHICGPRRKRVELKLSYFPIDVSGELTVPAVRILAKLWD